MIRVSAGTAHVLGLKSIQSQTDPTTGYFLTGDVCSGACAFCPQAQGQSSNLSRIVWPEFSQSDILAALAQQTSLKRYCFQVADGTGWLGSTERLLRELRSAGLTTPSCVSCRPRNTADIQRLLQAGAERVSIALDACTPEVAAKVGRDWHGTWTLLQDASGLFPGRISTHLIIGLGETEREACQCMQELYELGISIALFAFTPVKGTPMSALPQPDVGRYRRLQAAHNLLRVLGAQEFRWSPRGVLQFSDEQIEALAPKTFETSGCPDCNRPYYNERPNGIMYNYPRPLSAVEFQQCLSELEAVGDE